jgi:hypothetical protein
MISLNPPDKARGQAFLETLLGLTALLLVSFVGVLILLQGIGTLVALKWAAQNSLCIAQQKSVMECKLLTRQGLENYFGLSHVQVNTRTTRGIIHSEVDARIAGQAIIHGVYDLGPSEYKRVAR